VPPLRFEPCSFQGANGLRSDAAASQGEQTAAIYNSASKILADLGTQKHTPAIALDNFPPFAARSSHA
jgi:hypothetical protein